MKKIKTKLDSDECIRSSGVNYSPFFIAFDYRDAIEAVEKLKEPIGIREKRGGGGSFIFDLTKEQAISLILRQVDEVRKKTKPTFQYPCGVYYDMRETEDHLLYQGEIQLHSDGTMCGVYCTVPGIKNREACRHKEAVHFGTYAPTPNPFLDKSWDYKPIRYAVDYICKYNIIGPVVEYSVYDIPTGWKKEPIVIWEIRNF